MKLSNKFISLIVVMLMVAAAAITVNKAIFGHIISSTDSNSSERAATAISEMPDGTLTVHTGALSSSINGYAGPVPLDITISNDTITNIEVLANSESPSFFNRTLVLLENWIGKPVDEAANLKVDGISGATYSSMAIINNVDAGLDYYLGSAHNRRGTMPLKLWVAFGITLAACIVPLFVRNKLYRNIQLLANIVVLGFWSGQFLDYALILKYMSGGFLLPAGLTAIVMLIAAFIYPLFGHPQHYCNHICPLGSAQILVAQLCRYKIHISARILKWLDWFRRILWASLMILLWIDCLTGWMDLELFQAFQVKSASWWIISFAILFVALSSIVARPYCRFVCPTGSLFKRAENIG